MLTVRFPDGTSLQYNSATKVQYGEHCFTLLNDQGQWVAMVGYNCLIEATTPDRISHPIRQPSPMIKWVLDHLREIPSASLAQLKRELSHFNAQTRRWKY